MTQDLSRLLDDLKEALVEPPVEPKGILSRIEQHCARLLEGQQQMLDALLRIDPPSAPLSAMPVVPAGRDPPSAVAAARVTFSAVDETLAMYRRLGVPSGWLNDYLDALQRLIRSRQ